MALDSNYVSRVSRKLRKCLKRKDRVPSPEQVHNIRTTIRRVEAAAGAVISKPKRRDKAVLKDMRRIRKQAGKVRDMDVLTADAATVRIAIKQREELTQLLEYLGSQRYKEAKRLRSLVRKKGARLRKRVKQFSMRLRRRVRAQERVDGTGAFPEVLATTVQLLSDLKRPSRLSPRNLHPYRLTVKKLRDVVRLSDNVNHSRLASALGDVKDAIGDWHDWEELGSLADTVLEESSGILSRAIRQIARRKYAHALLLSEHMRREILYSKNGGLRKSVVQTTAGMAK